MPFDKRPRHFRRGVFSLVHGVVLGNWARNACCLYSVRNEDEDAVENVAVDDHSTKHYTVRHEVLNIARSLELLCGVPGLAASSLPSCGPELWGDPGLYAERNHPS